MTTGTGIPPALGAADTRFLAELGQQLRADSIRCSTAAGSGHPTSAMSAADLMAVLLARHLRYDWDNPGEPGNDHLIFSKGHASPLLYAMFKAAGAIVGEELVTGFRRFGSRLQGHPTPALPWVDVATGSLGHGLPYGVGIALAGRRLDKLPYQVWVLCGDSEMAEGSMWEALDKAAYYRLGNLTAIVDVNRLGQRGPTELEWDMAAYRRRAGGFRRGAGGIPAQRVNAPGVVGPKMCTNRRTSSRRAARGSTSGGGTVRVVGGRAPAQGVRARLLYTSDAAAQRSRVDLGGRRVV